MRYALYLRKSTEEDERQAQSLGDQKQRGLDYARNKGWSDPIVIEEACSAKEPGRPEFNRMLQLIDQGKLDGVLAWHPDRLSRNEMDAAALTMRVRKGQLAELHFVNYYFHNSPEGMMMLQIALSQSQYFSSKLVLDVKRGLESKMTKGWYPHFAPPGYVNDKHKDKGEKTISLDPVRAPLIRRLFDHVLTQGFTPKELLSLLNDTWGYRSLPTRKRGEQPMSKSTLYRLLGNRFYTGYFVHAGSLYPGQHPPLLSLDEFQRIQHLLGRSQRQPTRKQAFAYTGMIACAYCKRQITAQVTTNRQGHQYVYYRCLVCRGQNVAESVLERQINAVIERIHIAEPDFLLWGEEAVRRFVIDERQTDHALYAQKLSTLASLDSQMDALLTALTKGLIDDEEYSLRKRQLQEVRLGLREETQQRELRADQAREAMENVLVFLENVKAWMTLGDLNVKRACVRALGTNFLLSDKKLLWEPHPLLEGVQKDYKELEGKYREIKLDETLSESAKQAGLEGVRSVWSGIWVRNQTLAAKNALYFPTIAALTALGKPSVTA